MTDNESLMARIIGDVHSQFERGEEVDPERVIAQHPEIAKQLRARFEALALLTTAAKASSDAGLRMLPDDRYAEYKPIGEGGMGIVYWAIDLSVAVRFRVNTVM